MLLRVARRDQAAHGVADQDDRQAGLLDARGLGHQPEIGHHVLAVLDQRPLALRATVAQVVGRIDHPAVGDQRVGDVVVAPRVLAVAVGEEYDITRLVAEPAVDCDAAAAAVELEGDGFGHGGQPTRA